MFVETKEAGEVAAPATITKLSEAIRIGAAKRPQCLGGPFKDGGSCAIGAAYEGITGRVSSRQWNDLDMARVLPSIYSSPGTYTPLGSEIYRLNDDAGWTREQIADWLERKGY